MIRYLSLCLLIAFSSLTVFSKDCKDWTKATIDPNCTTLDLWGNNIGALGATALAEALQHNTALTWLNLWDNNLGDVGATAIAKALQHNTSLTTLALAYNNIGKDAKKALNSNSRVKKGQLKIYW